LNTAITAMSETLLKRGGMWLAALAGVTPVISRYGEFSLYRVPLAKSITPL
jgi:hypothetical protein